MKNLLEKARNLPDNRKMMYANTIAGIITVAILTVWSTQFIEKVSSTPATAAGAIDSDPEFLGIIDQIKTLISEIRSDKDSLQIEVSNEINFDQQP